jgi:hypothetical protein
MGMTNKKKRAAWAARFLLEIKTTFGCLYRPKWAAFFSWKLTHFSGRSSPA